MPFFESEFSRKIGFLPLGGDCFYTTVNEAFSGFEQRNRNWIFTRGKWKILFKSRPYSEFLYLDTFFKAVGGRADGFRFFDKLDNVATGQPLGNIPGPGQTSAPVTGDGTTTAFQLLKIYGLSGRQYIREVHKPIMSTVVDYQGNPLTDTITVYVNGVAQVLNTDYTLDATTGIVGFATAPGSGAVLTADFRFHKPARFNTDEPQWQIDESSPVENEETNLPENLLVTWNGLEIWEIRNLAA